MLEILNAIYPSEDQFLAVFRGMRNPFKAQEKADSFIDGNNFIIGDKDLDLAKRLIHSGPDHRKFLRQLPVILEIKAPLYFWKQLDAYHIATVTNAESTMHTLTKKEFERSDFSLPTEKIPLEEKPDNTFGIDDCYLITSIPFEYVLDSTIAYLNDYRLKYLTTKEKKYWEAVNALLPQAYNQARLWSGNYEVLRNICRQRKGHKLKEWKTFIDFIEDNVPYSKELIIA